MLRLWSFPNWVLCASTVVDAERFAYLHYRITGYPRVRSCFPLQFSSRSAHHLLTSETLRLLKSQVFMSPVRVAIARQAQAICLATLRER